MKSVRFNTNRGIQYYNGKSFAKFPTRVLVVQGQPLEDGLTQTIANRAESGKRGLGWLPGYDSDITV